MIKIMMEDITCLKKVDAIVNASNGKGPMGAGVAKSIALAGGQELVDEVKFKCKLEGGYRAGSFFTSTSGNMKNFKKVYHAVTMDYPGGMTSLEIIKQCVIKTLDQAIVDGITSIAFPGLGTGIGKLDAKIALETMFHIFLQYEEKIDIYFIDVNRKIIDEAEIIYEKFKRNSNISIK